MNIFSGKWNEEAFNHFTGQLENDLVMFSKAANSLMRGYIQTGQRRFGMGLTITHKNRLRIDPWLIDAAENLEFPIVSAVGVNGIDVPTWPHPRDNPQKIFATNIHGLAVQWLNEAAKLIFLIATDDSEGYYGLEEDETTEMLDDWQVEKWTEDEANHAVAWITEALQGFTQLLVALRRERMLVTRVFGRNGTSVTHDPPEKLPFLPNRFQRDLLDRLNGVALKGEALAQSLGVNRTDMFKRGLAELRDKELVLNKSGGRLLPPR